MRRSPLLGVSGHGTDLSVCPLMTISGRVTLGTFITWSDGTPRRTIFPGALDVHQIRSLNKYDEPVVVSEGIIVGISLSPQVGLYWHQGIAWEEIKRARGGAHYV
jgi:hypothetical protein